MIAHWRRRWRRLRGRSAGRLPALTWRGGAGAPDDVGRVLGLVTDGEVTHDATFAHPPASAHTTFDLVDGWLLLPVRVLPEGLHSPDTRISVTLTITSASTGRTSRTWDGTTRTWQRWRELRLRLPDVDGSATLTIAVEAPGRPGNAWAWVATGAPRLERRRTLRELGVAIRTVRDRAQTVGWRRAVRQAIQGPAPLASIDYAAWVARHRPSDATLAAQRAAAAHWAAPPRLSVLTPTFNTRAEWLQDAHASLTAQSYPHWQWVIADDGSSATETQDALDAVALDPRVVVVRRETNGGIAAASNTALAHAAGDIVVLLDHDDTLPPHALFTVAERFHHDATLDAVYSDEDKRELDGTPCEPYCKPGWSPDLLLGTNYACHLTAMRRQVVSDLGGFRPGYEGAQDFDLWLRVSEATDHIAHIPDILYHWRKVPGSTAAAQSEKPDAADAGLRAVTDAARRRGWDATVERGVHPGYYRVRHHHDTARVSVLMPTYGAARIPSHHVARVVRAVQSLGGSARHATLEFVCATDDGTVPDDVERALSPFAHHIVAVPGPFNFSARINAAAAVATGSVFLLANDDLEAIDAEWLDALRDFGDLPGVGAVGARLDLPDGRVQHAGILLGVRGVAAHAFHHAEAAHPGYFGSLISPRNVSAVSAACLLTRAEVFRMVGGFDEQLPIDFNDVDYCLRVQAAGLRVVVTPYARLRHHESASLGARPPGAAAVSLMQQRWPAVIARDPYYHPRLSVDTVDYRLAEDEAAAAR